MRTSMKTEAMERLSGGSAGELTRETVEKLAGTQAEAPAPARTLEVIGAEIRDLTAGAKAMSLWFAVEIGRRLTEAKAACRHGEWLDFLKRETEYSERKAQMMMQVFEGYGSRQVSIFGAELANPKTFSDLSFSKALALLAIEDEGEREEFIEVHDVEAMSTRELKEAIRERDEVRNALDEARRKAVRWEDQAGSYASQINDLQGDLKEAQDTVHSLTDQIDRAERERDELREKAADARQDAEEAQAEAGRLREAVKELEARPIATVTDPAEIDRAVAEAVKKADAEAEKLRQRLEKAEKAAETAKKKADGLQKKADAGAEAQRKTAEEAHAEADRLRSEVDRLNKLLTVSGNKDLAAFELLYEQARGNINQLHGLLIKARSNGDETNAGRYQKALLALSDAVRGCAE